MSKQIEADQLASGVIITSRATGHLLVISDAVIADASAGYAPGCLLIDKTNGVVYINEGSRTSSDFDAITTA